MRRDTGAHGEYLTYRELCRYEKKGARFLFNVYVPKSDGGTTEIDVLTLSRKGIFIYESKNYGGWIFGDENAEKWYQTFPNGHKESFYSPIFQNHTHIYNLQKFLGRDVLMHSIIVFSKRCTLKSVHWTPDKVTVTKRGQLARDIRRIWHNTADVLTDNEVDELYNRLYPLTQVSDEVKQAHIDDIQRKYSNE